MDNPWKKFSEERPTTDPGFRRTILICTMGYVALASVVNKEVRIWYTSEIEYEVFKHGDRIEFWMPIPETPQET